MKNRLLSALSLSEQDVLVLSPFGSQLYGLTTGSSDLDFKGVYLPPLQAVLEEQKSGSLRWSTGPKKDRNKSGDIDLEFIPLNRFFSHCLQGQTLAFDLLHSTEKNYLVNSELWKELVANRHLFLSKRILNFVGYARNQARKYGIKGSRLSFVREIIDFLKNANETSKLSDTISGQEKPDNSFFTGILDIAKKHSREDSVLFANADPDLSVLAFCGKTFFSSSKVSSLLECALRIEKSYGSRTNTSAGGIDYKAMSHAFRAISQVRLLVKEGSFSYPLPDSPFLMRVKLGQEADSYLLNRLDDDLDEVKQLIENSGLPDRPTDEAYYFTENLRIQAYQKQMKKNFTYESCTPQNPNETIL